jgi:NADPH:quinone reductase-like Zn-dependent oxidoreductase
VHVGDLCLLDGNITKDKHGYTLKVLAYDAPNTMGVLAKQTKAPAHCLIPLPKDSGFTAQEWAAFSVRYLTAWDNWKVALGCWQAQMADVEPSEMYVWGWGGGVALAQLALARSMGCQTAMIASSEQRLQLIRQLGMQPIDRRHFAELSFDAQRYQSDAAYRARYIEAEQRFLALVKEYTHGEGVSIFIDNIGTPVFRATLKALARQGVIATSGWKHGMRLSVLRGLECINRHIHVHTHGSRDSSAREAVQAAEKIGWRPPVAGDKVYKWEDIPQLAQEYAAGQIASYFPLFAVNGVTCSH